MLAYILALAVVIGSFAIYMAAFFFPEVHRKGDIFWSGIGLFYALVLWFCAGRITGAVLLGQTASVALLVWFGWQSMRLRWEVTPARQRTQVPSKTETTDGKIDQKSGIVSKLTGGFTTLFRFERMGIKKGKSPGETLQPAKTKTKAKKDSNKDSNKDSKPDQKTAAETPETVLSESTVEPTATPEVAGVTPETPIASQADTAPESTLAATETTVATLEETNEIKPESTEEIAIAQPVVSEAPQESQTDVAETNPVANVEEISDRQTEAKEDWDKEDLDFNPEWDIENPPVSSPGVGEDSLGSGTEAAIPFPDPLRGIAESAVSPVSPVSADNLVAEDRETESKTESKTETKTEDRQDKSDRDQSEIAQKSAKKSQGKSKPAKEKPGAKVKSEAKTKAKTEAKSEAKADKSSGGVTSKILAPIAGLFGTISGLFGKDKKDKQDKPDQTPQVQPDLTDLKESEGKESEGKDDSLEIGAISSQLEPEATVSLPDSLSEVAPTEVTSSDATDDFTPGSEIEATTADQTGDRVSQVGTEIPSSRENTEAAEVVLKVEDLPMTPEAAEVVLEVEDLPMTPEAVEVVTEIQDPVNPETSEEITEIQGEELIVDEGAVPPVLETEVLTEENQVEPSEDEENALSGRVADAISAENTPKEEGKLSQETTTEITTETTAESSDLSKPEETDLSSSNQKQKDSSEPKSEPKSNIDSE